MNRTIANQLGAALFGALLWTVVPLSAETPKVTDITPALIQAGAHVDSLRAIEVGGIVVLRGRAVDQESAIQAAALTQGLGYTRIANLIYVAAAVDDEAIERFAERQIGLSRSLEGCNIHVDSDNGVVRLDGTVRSELQKDVALQLVRNIDGVKSVQTFLKK